MSLSHLRWSLGNKGSEADALQSPVGVALLVCLTPGFSKSARFLNLYDLVEIAFIFHFLFFLPGILHERFPRRLDVSLGKIHQITWKSPQLVTHTISKFNIARLSPQHSESSVVIRSYSLLPLLYLIHKFEYYSLLRTANINRAAFRTFPQLTMQHNNYFNSLEVGLIKLSRVRVVILCKTLLAFYCLSLCDRHCKGEETQYF